MLKKRIDPERLLEKYQSTIEDLNPLRPMGRVVQVTGMSIITEGPPGVSIGEICRVERSGQKAFLPCEVVGFQNHRLVLMPLGPISGIYPECDVLATGKRLEIPVTTELLGRVIDGSGRPLDSMPPILSREQRLADYDPPDPIKRIPIRTVLSTGVRAIDGLLTIGRGQRIGIFAGTGVGKSTLLGMIARYTDADVNVICLVGERGREVREFIENDLGKYGLKKSVVITATSDRPAMEKVNAASFATSIAEFFRDQGKNVNLLMDSLTRYSMALREIGIASGDQLGPGGYPPGVWYRMSRLVERSGQVKDGSITGFYSVLVEGDDMLDPVADNARGILDGHIVLSRRLAQKGHYPAIEVTESISRVMDRVTEAEHLQLAGELKRILSAYRESEELINLGAYARGSNADVDFAIANQNVIQKYLRQAVETGVPFDESVAALRNIIKPGTEEDYY
ncbi:MAG: FliI/YscN family ATPase [Spirochaetales bacterium]|nr:FliI/YscN family ATPase [Spirochaetales bacterium]